ncbi:hypothetical protein SPRG_06437 [Saprolegnia parasitica CBS 223.65]|uniref:Uncharacterized protein n=1 Tax=Saprolegnia parasitica (strain CBS 223.65) TaxID=695850 RepID=A0A067CPW9_SAPPC|nr:hypothetical protein SPRG_06437 [Saprolegnia parasitica CBS 223.65]KDO28581.1 hypothetical protein SPRG_06437 [Saprolegnia parasitica CBS 223.65]|eukprot:XP_012200644.1 hypothetical protein SPRG_06437 [Saprolegnia parasitica CBS 223.65]
MTFCSSVILGQPEIAAIVFGYQDGLYEDSFRQTFAPNDVWSDDFGHIRPRLYALHENELDARLPLHDRLEIAEPLLDTIYLLDNISFLLDTLALPGRRHKTTLHI